MRKQVFLINNNTFIVVWSSQPVVCATSCSAVYFRFIEWLQSVKQVAVVFFLPLICTARFWPENTENQFCDVEHFLTLARIISCRKRVKQRMRASKRMNEWASSAHESKIISAYYSLYAHRVWAAQRFFSTPFSPFIIEIWDFGSSFFYILGTLNKRLPAMNDANANMITFRHRTKQPSSDLSRANCTRKQHAKMNQKFANAITQSSKHREIQMQAQDIDICVHTANLTP